MRPLKLFSLALMFALVLALPALAGNKPSPPGGGTSGSSSNPVPGIPEPGAFALFALGAGMVGLVARRRARA